MNYLLIGTKDVSKKIEILEKYLLKQNLNVKSELKPNIKDVTLSVEKNWTKYEKTIILDKDGIFPFMYLSKVHKLVVARVTDVYSAYMTPLHNNTKVIVIPTSIIADESINKLSKYFIDAQFEAERHMVRIDMLNKETE